MDVPKKAIVESIETAKDYAAKLEELLCSVREAENQVQTSTQKSIEQIEVTFELLASTIIDTLERRKKVLTSQALKYQTEGLKPLNECHKILENKLRKTESFIEEGEKLVSSAALEKCLKYVEEASQLVSLPAVPNPEEVNDLSFICPVDSILTELQSKLMDIGTVSKMGPVQLTELQEKPGSLLVQWEEVDFERTVDVHSFRLQLAYGDIRGQEHLIASNFHDTYVGPETQHLVRDLRPGVPYTFRVCCRIEGDSNWSAWSLPRVAVTNQDPFCWEASNPNYIVTNDNKIASKVSPDQSVLLSSKAQFGPGHSIEFTLLECGVGCSDEGIGLVDGKLEGENLIQSGCLFINSQGSVFVDGVEKTTKLPCLEKGSKVSFTCEHIRDNKIRVNIDSNNKTVTYDWNISSASLKLYFALCFGERGWKVLVE